MTREYLHISDEDGEAQGIRVARARERSAYDRQVCGWAIGRGFEADLHDAVRIADGMRYRLWLKRRAFNSTGQS